MGVGELHANTPFARIRAEQEGAQKPREMVAHIQAALRPMPQRGNRRALHLEMVRRVMLQQAAIDCDAQRIPRPARARHTLRQAQRQHDPHAHRINGPRTRLYYPANVTLRIE